LQATLVIRVSRQFTGRIFRRGTNVPPAYFLNRIIRIALFPEQVREVRRRFHSMANPPLNSKNCGPLARMQGIFRRSSVQAIGKEIEPQKLDVCIRVKSSSTYISPVLKSYSKQFPKNNTFQLLIALIFVGKFRLLKLCWHHYATTNV
jgi:hypothetical protein